MKFKILIIVTFILILSCLILNQKHKILIIGDSRVGYMYNFNIINDTNSVYAGSMGYDWFIGNISSHLDSTTYNCKTNAIECSDNKTNKKSNIIIWLGVNDLDNYERYFQKYCELAKTIW